MELSSQPSVDKELKETFHKCQEEGKIRFEYLTVVWYGKITD
jgi:hypothetical protein